MRKRWIAVVIGISVMLAVVASPAEAAGPLRKLARGAVNTATGWLEIPFQIARTTELEGSLAGLSSGLLHGTGAAVGRTILGVYEVATFPFRNTLPTPGGEDPYGPLIEPEFVIFRQVDKP